MLKRLFINYLIFLACLFTHISLHAEPYVNIISWWGYLDYPWVSSFISKRCGVQISVDQYYSTDEFIKLFKLNSNSYDIAIFQSPSYDEIHHLIPSIESSKIYLNSKKYHPIIRKHYNERKFPHNVAYFFQSITGVLWNDNIIKHPRNLTLPSILNNVSGKFISSLDDPAYFSALISMSNIGNGRLIYKNYQKLFGNNTVIFSNPFYRKIYDNKNFALSYTWSGEAIQIMQQVLNKTKDHLHFSINPSYSVVSSDVVAAINNKPTTECVANVLASKDFMNKLQIDTYYFTPFVEHSDVKNDLFLTNYKLYANSLAELKWLPILTKEQTDSLKESWSYIAMKARENLNKSQNIDS